MLLSPITIYCSPLPSNQYSIINSSACFAKINSVRNSNLLASSWSPGECIDRKEAMGFTLGMQLKLIPIK